MNLLTPSQVEEVVGISSSALISMSKKGEFPSPIWLSKVSPRWIKEEVEKWVPPIYAEELRVAIKKEARKKTPKKERKEKKQNPLKSISIDEINTKGTYSDGNRLYLMVRSANAKSWMFRYRKNGKTHHLGLGSAKYVSLEEAREKALELCKKITKGIDPLSEKRGVPF